MNCTSTRALSKAFVTSRGSTNWLPMYTLSGFAVCEVLIASMSLTNCCGTGYFSVSSSTVTLSPSLFEVTPVSDCYCDSEDNFDTICLSFNTVSLWALNKILHHTRFVKIGAEKWIDFSSPSFIIIYALSSVEAIASCAFSNAKILAWKSYTKAGSSGIMRVS